jgi:hypothetical protein
VRGTGTGDLPIFEDIQNKIIQEALFCVASFQVPSVTFLMLHLSIVCCFLLVYGIPLAVKKQFIHSVDGHLSCF